MLGGTGHKNRKKSNEVRKIITQQKEKKITPCNIGTKSVVKEAKNAILKVKPFAEKIKVISNDEKIIKERKQSEETKQKIRESVLKYFETNLEKHSESMAKAVGIKVAQYSKSNKLVATYNSIAEASRQTNLPKSTIGNYIRNGSTDQSAFIWRQLKD